MKMGADNAILKLLSFVGGGAIGCAFTAYLALNAKMFSTSLAMDIGRAGYVIIPVSAIIASEIA